MPLASGFYPTVVIGKLRPPAIITQWNIDSLDPSGYRHWMSGQYKPDAKRAIIGGFTAQRESGTFLNFDEVYVNSSGFYTNTTVFTFNFGEVNTHPSSFFNLASGIGTNFKGFNVRFWIDNKTAFSGYNPIFYYLTSQAWRQGLHLKSNTIGVQVVPSSLPATQNIPTSSDNQVFISGVYQDREFSHYIYTVGKFPSGINYVLGTYGGQGSNDFLWRISYDWSSINANILPMDID